MQFENPESTFFSVTWTIFCSGIIHPSLGNQIIKDKSLGKTPIWVILCFSPLPPTSQCWGTKSKTCVKQCYGFTTLYRGRGGGLLNMLCEIPIIFCHWLSEFYKKKKKKTKEEKCLNCCCFQLLLSGICQKIVITISTPWPMLQFG